MTTNILGPKKTDRPVEVLQPAVPAVQTPEMMNAYNGLIASLAERGAPVGGETIRQVERLGVSGDQLIADVRAARINRRRKAIKARESLPALSEAAVRAEEKLQALLDGRDEMKTRNHTPFELEQISRQIEVAYSDAHSARTKYSDQSRFATETLRSTADPGLIALLADLTESANQLVNENSRLMNPNGTTIIQTSDRQTSATAKALRASAVAKVRDVIQQIGELIEQVDSVVA